MFAEFGYGILLVSFLVAIYAVGVAVYWAPGNSYALVESARRAMLLTFPLVAISRRFIYLFADQQSLRGLLCL